MKKYFYIIAFFFSIIGKLNAQTFQEVSGMFEYALQHYMEVYPDSSYYSYFPQPGKPYYVAVYLPDSCGIEETFSPKKFPDVVFCEGHEIPLKLRLQARAIHHHRNKPAKTSKAPVLHLILYWQNDSKFKIEITDLTIHRIKGKVSRVGVCGAGCFYTFVQHQESSLWELYEIEKSGIHYTYL